MLSLINLIFRYIHLVNHAPFSVTSQSTTSWGGHSFNAVDGNTSQNFFQYSCTHTLEQDNPWWSAIFERGRVNISAIRIFNRGDCCLDRLSNFEVRVGEFGGDESTKSPRCGGLHTVSGLSKVIACPNLVGHYLTIRIPGRRKILTLCEVQVFGTGKFFKH